MNLVEFFEKHAYSSLFGFVFVEEIGVPLPVPGDALLLFLGIQSLDGRANFWLVLLITIAATILGSSILFLVSRMLGRPLLIKYERYLKYIHITDKDIRLLEHYMADYGVWVLIVSRLTPGLRIVGTVAAGVLGISYARFILATTAGTIIWTIIYFWLGAYLGRQFADQIAEIFGNKWLMAGLFVAGLSIWLLLFKLISPALKRHRHAGVPADRTSDGG